MNLSMHIIADWMSDKVIFSKIDNNDCIIAGCTLSYLDNSVLENCLYISKAGQHPEAKDAVSVICRFKNDYLVIDSDNEIEVYQSITNAFLFYNQWENRLKDAVINSVSFQEIAEIAYPVFKSHILCLDWRGIILGSTPANPAETVGAILDPVMFKKIQDGETCKKVAQNVIPAGFVTTPVFPSVIAFNVFFSDDSFVLFYISSNATEHRKAHLQLALFMRSILSYMKPSNTGFEGNLSSLYDELIQILDGKLPDHEKIKEIQMFKAWQDEEFYSLFVFDSQADFSLKRKGINWMLAEKCPFSIVFPYRNYALMLLPTSKQMEAERTLSTILPYFDTNGIVCIPFSGWKNLRTVYNQIQTIRRFVKPQPGKLYHCQDYAWEYIMLSVQSRCQALRVISPDALKLQDYDRTHGTELLKTLNIFLKSQSNMTSSSEQLYIHLNSMKYRIKKIESLISADLKKYEDRMILLFSSEILLNNQIEKS